MHKHNNFFLFDTMSYSWLRSSSCLYLFACIWMGLATSSSSSFDGVSYAQHCSSVVPEYNITHLANRTSLPHLSTQYFTGSDTLLRAKHGRTYYYLHKYLWLHIRSDNYYETTVAGVYKVEGLLRIRFQYFSGDAPTNGTTRVYYHRRSPVGLIDFPMKGFWSKNSRKLCMLGSTLWEGIDRDAVLKVKFHDKNPTIYTGVVSGSLESIASANDPSYFDPILMFKFPTDSIYNYSLVPKEVGKMFSSDSDVGKDDSLRLGAKEFCLVMEVGLRNMELEYATDCKGCFSVGFLPRFLSLTSIQCLWRQSKARFLAKFQNNTQNGYSGFALGSTLIGEASWDDKNKRIIGVACEILNPLQHFGNAVGDCTLRFSLRHSLILTIRKDARIAGQIWSSKSVNDSGYLGKISVSGYDSDEYSMKALPGLKYEYTELERARKSCTAKKAAKKGNVYPGEHSNNMKVDMIIKNGRGQLLASAYAGPSWVGNDFYRGNNVLIEEGEGVLFDVEPNVTKSSGEFTETLERDNTLPTKMSYKIRLSHVHRDHHLISSNISLPSSLNWLMSPYGEVEITAEGLYDAQNGILCMVGCRKMVQNSTTFKDCEMVVELELPPLNGKSGGLIKGTIRSTRATTDALHFDDLLLQSVAHYFEEAERTIRRMDFEIMMVLVSNTLICIFVGLQIFHVKRNPEVPSFISLVMHVVLCVGHLIPLVLTFEAVLGNHEKHTLNLGSGGKLEANEVAVRVIKMVALLLQLRLLQLVWTAKLRDDNGKGSWDKEKKVGFVSLSMYILGGMSALILNWMRNWSSVLGDLRSYGGLILDGFLVPQILLNIFSGSSVKALSHPFYIGISAVRLVPHVYNQYRAHKYPKFDLNATYYFANPAADFYSTAWDIMIPCGIISLVVIVFLQQRNGGRCILPQRFRAMEIYEKLPTTADNHEEDYAE